jgi:hypothetical protein
MGKQLRSGFHFSFKMHLTRQRSATSFKSQGTVRLKLKASTTESYFAFFFYTVSHVRSFPRTNPRRIKEGGSVQQSLISSLISVLLVGNFKAVLANGRNR